MIRVWDRNFTCDECPICVGVEHRLRIAEEGGYEPQLEYCGCDKVEFEFFLGGFCEDAFAEEPTKKKRGKRRTGSAYRRAMAVKKRNDLFHIINETHAPFAGYTDWDFVDGVWKPVGKYVKHHKNSNRQRFWKRYSNRAVRRGVQTGSGKSGYKRCFDYWWEID